MPSPQVDSAAAWHTMKSRVRSTRQVIPDQVVAMNVGEAEPCANGEGNMLKNRIAGVEDNELLGAVQDSVDATTDNNSREGPRTFFVLQETEGMVTPYKTSLQPNPRIPAERRNSHELSECSVRESHSSVIRNTETSNNPMLWGATNGKLAGIDFSNGDGAPVACIKQNGWPMEGSVTTCDEVEEVLSCPIGSEQGGRTFYRDGPSTTLLLSSGWTSAENVSGGVPELGKASQMNGEEVIITKKTELPGSCQIAKTSVAAKDTVTIEAAAEELHSVQESDQHSIPVVPSREQLSFPSPSPRENPGQTFFQCKVGPDSKVTGHLKSMPTRGKVSVCSHEEGRMSDEAAATIRPLVVDPASLAPVRSVPCLSTTIGISDWECLGLPSHMDFSTIKEKLRNNKLAVDDLRPFSDNWRSFQDESYEGPSIFEEAGADSSEVQTAASQKIIPSDVSNHTKHLLHENPTTVAIEDASKRTCPPCEIGAIKESGLRRLPSRSENTTNSKADPNYKYSDSQEFIMPHAYSAEELSNFLPSHYFRQEMIQSNKASAESTISEDLENYESDIEELQDDAVSSGYNVVSTSTCKARSPIPSNNAATSKPDSAFCVAFGSTSTETFHSDSNFLGVTNGLSGTGEVCKTSSSIHNLSNQDLTVLGVPKPCSSASGMGATGLWSRRFENPLSLLHTGDQCNSQTAASCTSKHADEDWTGSSQSIRASVTEDKSNLLTIPRDSENDYCGSEVPHGSHPQSESVSEEVQSVDSETTSLYRSALQRENDVHRANLVELDTREESSKDDDDMQNKSDAASKYYSCNTVVSSSAPPVQPDCIENVDRKRHVLSMPGLITLAGTAVQENTDNNSSFKGCAAKAADSQEIARSRNSQHHATLPLDSDTLALESSKPVELPVAFKIPQLRTSEDSIQCNDATHLAPVSSFRKLSCARDYQVREALFEDEKHLFENICGMKIESAFNRLLVTETLSNAAPGGQISIPGEIMKTAITALDREPSEPGTVCNLDVASLEGSPILVTQKTVDHLEVSGPTSHQMGPIQECDAKSFGVISDERDCSHENSLTEALKKTEPLSDENHELLYSFTASDSSSDHENASNDTVGEEDNESAVAVSSHSIYGHSGSGLRKLPYLGTKGRVVTIPLDCGGSKSDPTTFTAKDTLDSSCPDLFSGLSGDQQLTAECRIVDVESKRSFNSIYDDHGGLATTEHQKVPAYRDLQETETSYRSQNTSLRPDQIIALKTCNAGKLTCTSLLFGNQKRHIDVDKCAEENADGLDTCSSNVLLLKSAQENMGLEENESLSRCVTQEDDVGWLGSKPVSSSDAFAEEQMRSTSCLTALHEASFYFSTSSDDTPKMLGGITHARRAEKHNIMTDLLTSMIYDDLLRAELSGFHQEVETTSLKTSAQMDQTAKVAKAFNPKVKTRSRKVSEFCKVLKHFLPVGWRAASIRHKTGLFLHVEGLRPHPLNPATRAMPGTLNRSVQYPCYGQSERFPKSATPQFLSLDSSDLQSYVQRSLEVSSLILGARAPKWCAPKKPVVEHVVSASHSFECNQLQIHGNLISDLIDEILLKQSVTELLLPSTGMAALPLPAGAGDLAQFVTNGILMHERHAAKHGFDIEKVIAKAFEDEHWEKCSEEARDVVSDIAQDILGDLIEKFVYEMIRGWCYYINQCHLLAT